MWDSGRGTLYIYADRWLVNPSLPGFAPHSDIHIYNSTLEGGTISTQHCSHYGVFCGIARDRATLYGLLVNLIGIRVTNMADSMIPLDRDTHTNLISDRALCAQWLASEAEANERLAIISDLLREYEPLSDAFIQAWANRIQSRNRRGIK